MVKRLNNVINLAQKQKSSPRKKNPSIRLR